MEMNMGKFSEKLVELLELAKKKKNVLEYQEISDFFKDQSLEVEQMEKVLDFSSGVYSVCTAVVCSWILDCHSNNYLYYQQNVFYGKKSSNMAHSYICCNSHTFGVPLFL